MFLILLAETHNNMDTPDGAEVSAVAGVQGVLAAYRLRGVTPVILPEHEHAQRLPSDSDRWSWPASN